MLRGNNGGEIFFSNTDRRQFYFLLSDALALFDCKIHAFCLMSNHVHLLMEVNEEPLSHFMQNVNARYTQWINRRLGRVGHLFQGRYKAFLVGVDSYFLEVVRYIHLNPVRAGLVSSPERYVWSSHNAYLGNEKNEWLTTHQALSCFSSVSATARLEYADFVCEGIESA